MKASATRATMDADRRVVRKNIGKDSRWKRCAERPIPKQKNTRGIHPRVFLVETLARAYGFFAGLAAAVAAGAAFAGLAAGAAAGAVLISVEARPGLFNAATTSFVNSAFSRE